METVKRLNISISGVPEGEDWDDCSRLGFRPVHFRILWAVLVPDFPVDWPRRLLGLLHSSTSLC